MIEGLVVFGGRTGDIGVAAWSRGLEECAVFDVVFEETGLDDARAEEEGVWHYGCWEGG